MFVVSVIVGVVVTLICAIAPAIRSGRVPPLAAMRDVAVDRSALSRGRMIAGGLMLVAAIGCTVLGVSGDAIWLGPGVAGLFASLVVLGPLLAAPVSRVVTKPLTALRGVSGEIAGRNAATSPKRTALTAGALAIGLALLIGVSTLGSSVKTSIRESIGEQFTGDFTVSTGDQGFGGLPESLTDELNELPEVDDAVGIGVASIQLIEDGEPVGKSGPHGRSRTSRRPVRPAVQRGRLGRTSTRNSILLSDRQGRARRARRRRHGDGDLRQPGEP